MTSPECRSTPVFPLRRMFLFLAGFIALQIIPSAASAQESWPTIVVRGGALIADLGSDVRVDGSIGGIGTSIDLEEDLGFATKATSAFVDGTWRLSRRNQLRFEYEGVRRDVSHELIDRTITFRDQTFTIGAQVDSFLDTAYWSGEYGFAFVATPKVEVGASIGLTVLRLHTGIGFSAQVTGKESVSRDLSDTGKFTVPVPLPGVFLNVRPHPRVTVNGSVRVIKATIGDYTASLAEAVGAVDVRVAGPLGVGASYYYNHADVERKGTLTDGRIKYAFNGPQVYAALSF